MQSTRFATYVARSFIPRKFSRLCILGVDIVGIPVLLVYGIPQSKTLAVIGWFGLRFALTGLCYLEHRLEHHRARGGPAQESTSSSLQVAQPYEQNAVSVSQMPAEDSANVGGQTAETPMVVACAEEVRTEVADSKGESMHVEFPRIESGPIELPNVENNGARTTRTTSMSSVDSGTTAWSECRTPDQSAVELPVELEYTEGSLETPRPDEARWFSTCQDEVLQGTGTPKSAVAQDLNTSAVLEDHGNVSESSITNSPGRPLRRKRSKYGACPLVPRKSSASLHLSQVTYDKPEVVTS